MIKNKWELKDHSDIERPFWEITNGVISICADDEDFEEDEKLTETRLQNIVRRLNGCNVEFYAEATKLEFEQHITIGLMQSQIDGLKKVLEDIAARNCDYGINALHMPDCRACNAKEALQQWKDSGKEVNDPCPHCGKELSRDRNLCCRECGKEVEG